MSRLVAVALGCMALALLTAAPAHAVQRFAAPADVGMGDCGSPAHACDLQQAVESAGPNDEVIVKSDTYNEGTDPLLFPANNLNVHGEAGMPKPVLSFGTIPGMTSQAVNVNGGSVSWLRIVSTQASLGHNVLFASGAAQIERVEVEGASNACVITGGARLRDSFCMTTTGAGTAAVTGAGGTTTVKFRNVTAKATVGGIAGIQAFAIGGNVTVDAKNVIADGAPDVQAFTLGGGDTATLTLANSNFATTASGGPGTESVTTACSVTNQTTPPMLGANLFTQLPGSVTINAGATDADIGTMDIDGELRPQGAAIDIGADEFAGAGPAPPGPCGTGGGTTPGTPTNPATPGPTAQPAAPTCKKRKKKKKKKRSASAAKKKKKKKKC